nr:PTS fructose transporter subunit IIA [uncultured Anaerostipes sp.]
MVNLIIATHGLLGAEMLHSASLVTGPIEHCESWGLNPGEDLEQKGKELLAAIQRLTSQDGIFIFTDILGGTPANLSLKYSKGRKIKVFAGVNLSMVLSFLEHRNDSFEEAAMHCMKDGQTGILAISDLLQERRENYG